MNKEDSIKEKFKQALQSTYKVISEDYKVGKSKKKDEKNYSVGEIDNILDKNQFKKLRAETDSEALKRRFSNRKLLNKNSPKNPSCRTLYHLAEKVRYELLGSEMLKGISKNFKDFLFPYPLIKIRILNIVFNYQQKPLLLNTFNYCCLFSLLSLSFLTLSI